MRICLFILNSFDYDSRAQLICRDILANGWRLDIIATSDGRLDQFEGAPIHKISQPTWPSRKRRFIEFNLKATAIGKALKADIYHAVDLDTLWAAVRAAEKNQAKLVYESRELYTELLALSNRPVVKALWRSLEKRLIKKADAIVTVNAAIASELAQRYDVAIPSVILNVAQPPEKSAPFDLRGKFGIKTKFILIYQGVLRPGQGLWRSLDILNLFPDASLVLVGDGPLKTELGKKAALLAIADRVHFAGKVPPDELLNYTAGADAGLLLMEPRALNNRLALPQKLFQYISVGVPPIVTDLPCLRQIVKDDNLGLVLPELHSPEDVNICRAFLERHLSEASQACQKAALKYNWEIEGKKLIGIYRKLVQ